MRVRSMWCVVSLLLLVVCALALDEYDPKYNSTYYTRGWHKYQSNTLFVNGDWSREAGFRDTMVIPDEANSVVAVTLATNFQTMNFPLTTGDRLPIGYLGLVEQVRSLVVTGSGGGMNSTEFLDVAYSRWLPFHGHVKDTWCVLGRPFKAVGVHGVANSYPFSLPDGGCGVFENFVNPALLDSLLGIPSILTKEFNDTQALDSFYNQYGTDVIFYINAGYWGMNLTFYDDDNVTTHMEWPGSDPCAFDLLQDGCSGTEPSQLRWVDGRGIHRCIENMDLSALRDISEESRMNLYDNMAARIGIYEREAGNLEYVALEPAGLYEAMTHCNDVEPVVEPDDEPLNVWEIVAIVALAVIVGLIVVIFVGYVKHRSLTPLNSDEFQRALI